MTRLRERLRLLNEAALATVKDTDLPEGIAGTEKSAAVVVVLRGRLASVLAAASAAAAAVERTANAPTPPERQAVCGNQALTADLNHMKHRL